MSLKGGIKHFRGGGPSVLLETSFERSGRTFRLNVSHTESEIRISRSVTLNPEMGFRSIGQEETPPTRSILARKTIRSPGLASEVWSSIQTLSVCTLLYAVRSMTL